MPNIHVFSDLDEIFERYCRGKKMIDIGGMSGDVNNVFPIEKLKKFADSIICVDANDNDGIDLSGIEFHQMKIEEFSSDRKFDVAFCGEIIEHIADQETFLRKVKSLLQEDGKIIITTPNSSALSDFYRIVKSGADPRQDIVRDRVNGVYLSGHVVIHNISTLRQLLHGLSIKITDVYYRKPVGGSKLKQFIRDRIIEWRPQLSSQIVVVGEFVDPKV